MNKLLKVMILLCGFTLWFTACSDDYDDTMIKKEITDIKTQLEKLNKEVNQLHTIVQALQENKVIIDVKETEEGHVITFSDNKSILIANGKNGNDGSKVGVDLFEGSYYWTLDGTWLTDKEGNKLPVSGKEGSTPQIAVDAQGYWTVNGERIKTPEGKDVKAEQLISSVVKGENDVTFELTDGSTIILPLRSTYLRFKEEVYTLKFNRPNKIAFESSDDLKNFSLIEVPEFCIVQFSAESKQVQLYLKDEAYGNGELCIRAVDPNGYVYMAIASINVPGKGMADPNGLYILNEGSMTTENGSLIYIDPKGNLKENVYRAANGSSLGNVAQDMYIYDGEIYIISQNGSINPEGSVFKNDGMLIVADANTMKRKASYEKEISNVLNWPTHIAVLDKENIFIRDNKGVYVFNRTTNALQYIEGTKGAAKRPMAIADGKVFVEGPGKIYVLQKGATSISRSIDIPKLSGIAKAPDGHIYASASGNSNTSASIIKINARTYDIIKKNDIKEKDFTLAGTFAASANFSVKADPDGDKIYYSGIGTKIWRHNFKTGESKMMVDANVALPGYTQTYNTVAVHPITGKVYLNRLKGFSLQYLINRICVFKEEGDSLTLERTYDDYTRFPAGIFFPSQFDEIPLK